MHTTEENKGSTTGGGWSRRSASLRFLSDLGGESGPPVNEDDHLEGAEPTLVYWSLPLRRRCSLVDAPPIERPRPAPSVPAPRTAASTPGPPIRNSAPYWTARTLVRLTDGSHQSCRSDTVRVHDDPAAMRRRDGRGASAASVTRVVDQYALLAM